MKSTMNAARWRWWRRSKRATDVRGTRARWLQWGGTASGAAEKSRVWNAEEGEDEGGAAGQGVSVVFERLLK